MTAFVGSLVGRDIRTLTGRSNRVLAVHGHTALVATVRSPAGRAVDLRKVQAAADQLYERGAVGIDVKVVGYRSAFVGAVLSLLPNTEAELRPRRIRLQVEPASTS